MGDDDGITILLRGEPHPVDGVEEGICIAGADAEGIDIGVVSEELHRTILQDWSCLVPRLKQIILGKPVR